MANLQSFERADYQQVKADLHRKILDRLDLEKLGKTEEARSERSRFAELKKAQPAAAGMATGRDQ